MGNNNNQFNVKDFIDEIESKEFLKSKTSARAEVIWGESRRLSLWHINRSFRERNLRENLCDALHDARVLKAINLVIEESDADSDDYGFPAIFAVVLKDVVDTQRRKLGDDEILEGFEKAIYTILKPEIKSLSKTADISKELAYELLSTLPSPDIVSRKNIIGVYVNKLNRKLYLAEQHETDKIKSLKTIRRIFKYLFGDSEAMGEIAVSILLERNHSNNNSKEGIYSLLSVFALDTLEGLPKEELRDHMKRYAERRKNEREGDRRLELREIPEDTYPRILKAIKKVSKKNPDLKGFF